MKIKRMYDIISFHNFEGEITIIGKDEYGEDFTLVMDGYEFLDTFNKTTIDHIKENIIKKINES